MKDIIVLTKKNCPMCKRTKMLLERNKVHFHTLDAEEDVDGIANVQYYGLSNSVLPRIIIDDELLPVFNTPEDTVNAIMKEIGWVQYQFTDKEESSE